MKHLFVEVFDEHNGTFSVPLESVIVLFALKYCRSTSVNLTLVLSDSKKRPPLYHVNLPCIAYDYVISSKVPMPANLCKLPVVVMNENTTCVAGICAVTRHLFKSVDPMHPYLGFKQSCLYACAEASIWTKFCEVDILSTVNNLFSLRSTDTKGYEIPFDIARFEVHMAQPVRVHNIEKVKRETARVVNNSTENQQNLNHIELDHLFSEGANPSIADVILFPYFHIILNFFRGVDLSSHIPLIRTWYERMLAIKDIRLASEIMSGLDCVFDPSITLQLPKVPFESLYKSDPKRYKPRHKIFTRQPEIEACLRIVEPLQLDMLEDEPFGRDVSFDWGSVPWDAQPEGGNLPVKRVERKSQQLENLTRAVLKLAHQGDRIVDFCAGSGHLGLIIAHSLPRCTIVLLENKEESLSRARDRAKKLHLSNIVFCQSNVDYFVGQFEVGTSLHACGVATDLVIDCCVRRRAAFACCPCCYGSLQPNHIVGYPRSNYIRTLPLSQREFLVLGHAADQTHDEANAKTSQGNLCMNVIDADRCLGAREAGYWVSLSKLFPPSCTPKNNLLIGIPRTTLEIQG